jgi:hypothetical protein
MKKLLFSLSIMIFAVAYLTGCKQDPNSSMNSLMPMKAPPPADAHPAWAFTSSKTVGSSVYSVIAVSDSDQTDVANVYTCGASNLMANSATWSTTGASISFIEHPQIASAWGTYTIKSVDVSVSGGVASGSNVQTIYSRVTSDSMQIAAQAWCPASGVNKIAFIGHTPTEDDIYTISTSGGTPTKIYSVAKADGNIRKFITWSNDGTELAFALDTGTSTNFKDAMKIIDLSGNVQATLIPGKYLAIFGVKWSHSGTDKISFHATTSTSGASTSYDIYTIGTTTGSTETKIVSASSSNAFWSPNNSELAYDIPSGTNAGVNKINVSSLANTFVGTSHQFGDWKTP